MVANRHKDDTLNCEEIEDTNNTTQNTDSSSLLQYDKIKEENITDDDIQEAHSSSKSDKIQVRKKHIKLVAFF